MDNGMVFGSEREVEAGVDEVGDAPGSVAGGEQQVLVEAGELLEPEERLLALVVEHSVVDIALAK